uniref:Uncharacterized protein n=1 Tax=Anguilla anguilla TaxID=7936 RepID=A0A0E9WDU4_ANGAN
MPNLICFPHYIEIYLRRLIVKIAPVVQLHTIRFPCIKMFHHLKSSFSVLICFNQICSMVIQLMTYLSEKCWG